MSLIVLYLPGKLLVILQGPDKINSKLHRLSYFSKKELVTATFVFCQHLQHYQVLRNQVRELCFQPSSVHSKPTIRGKKKKGCDQPQLLIFLSANTEW